MNVSTDPNDKQEGKLEVLERKQDITNSGLWYLCQAAGGVKDRISEKLFPVSSFTHHYHFKLKAILLPLKWMFVLLMFGRKLRQRRLQRLNMRRIPSRYENAAQMLQKLYLLDYSGQHLILKCPLFVQGLQFIADTKDSIVTAMPNGVKGNSFDKYNSEKVAVRRTRLHRSYPVGMSLA